jgi:protein TonB
MISIGHRNSHPQKHSPERFVGLILAILFHVGVFWWALQFDGVRRAIIDTAPIMVSFITPPKIEAVPKPKPTVKTPQPKQKPITSAPTVLATEATESPAQRVVPAVPKATEPIAVTVAPTALAAVSPPEFNAAYLHNPPPAYPAQSKRHSEEGKVLLRVYVSAAGTAEKVELQTSSGWPRLDQAAQEAVRSWRFVPAKQGDKAVAAWVIVPINFTVEG